MKEIISKDGVSIGTVPEDWTINKTLRCLSMPITDGPHETPTAVENGIPFVSAEAVSFGNGKIDFNHIWGYISEDYYIECCKKYTPQKDDIYMIKSGATTGKVAIVDTDRIFTIWSPLAVFRANKQILHPRYLYYFLQSPVYLSQVELGWNYGTQQNIGMRMLERLYICYPELSQQKSIVSFLDAKCSKIDEAIERHLGIIEKLEEYRKSHISNVMNSLSDKIKAKYVFDIYAGATPKSDTESYWGGDIVWITPADFKTEEHYISKSNRTLTESGYAASNTTIVPEGSLVVSKRAPIGTVGISTIPLCTNQGCLSCVMKENANAEFYYYGLISKNDEMQILSAGTTFQEISANAFANMYLPYAPIDEQDKIASELMSIDNSIAESKRKHEEIIDKLEEYKKSLIYNAVTGKIDCRNYQTSEG